MAYGHYINRDPNKFTPLMYGRWDDRIHLKEMFEKFLAPMLPEKKLNPWTWDNCECRPLEIFRIVAMYNHLNDTTFPDFKQFIIDLYQVDPDDEFGYYWGHFCGYMDEDAYHHYTPEYRKEIAEWEAQLASDYADYREEQDRLENLNNLEIYR